MFARIPQLLALRSRFTPLPRLLPQLSQRYNYGTSINGIQSPLSLSSLNTQADMALARNWIASFSKIGADDIPRDALDISYSRSSGPGGQNVNKLSTKATVRLILSRSTTFLPHYIIKNLTKSNYYTSSTTTSPGTGGTGGGGGGGGSILLSSSVHRTQPQNLEDALMKLKSIILKAANEGLVGETSELQKKKVEGLERKEKKKMEGVKRERKDVKSGRRKGGFD